MLGTMLRGAACALALHTMLQAETTVLGKVSDTARSAIEGATVTFTREADGSAFASEPTDAGGRYQVTLGTSTAVEGGTGAAVPVAPQLLQNHPNPFNPSTLIPYHVAETGRLRLVVYDVLGRPIQTLVEGVQTPGHYVASWHGRDEAGRPVGAGVYLIRMETGRLTQSRKMVLVDGAGGARARSDPAPSRKPAGSAAEEPDLYTVTVTGEGIERPEQRGVAVRRDTTMDLSVVRTPLSSTTPERLVHNLLVAMRGRDKDVYADLLDESFWFTEYDCQGELVFENNAEEELQILLGSRDGSIEGIFDIFRSRFDFGFTPNTRATELGPEYPKAYPGDPDGHPDEDWEAFRGRVQMLMIDLNGDGYRVDQVMTFKLRQVDEASDAGAQTAWKIIRWDDDPLAGDCGSARIAVEAASWGGIKAYLAR